MRESGQLYILIIFLNISLGIAGCLTWLALAISERGRELAVQLRVAGIATLGGLFFSWMLGGGMTVILYLTSAEQITHDLSGLSWLAVGIVTGVIALYPTLALLWGAVVWVFSVWPTKILMDARPDILRFTWRRCLFAGVCGLTWGGLVSFIVPIGLEGFGVRGAATGISWENAVPVCAFYSFIAAGFSAASALKLR